MADNIYNLKFTLSDGTVVDAGTFIAPQGEQGAQGERGISVVGASVTLV